MSFSLVNSDGGGVLNLDVEGVISGSGTGLTDVDAETLDGLDSLDFMPGDEDLWVNTTGDTMTGALTATDFICSTPGCIGEAEIGDAGTTRSVGVGSARVYGCHGHHAPSAGGRADTHAPG